MSIAGIRSNRGDGYQTLVALEWALTVLLSPEYQWIEIDSAKHTVDDVVAGREDGSLVCCQCKKNQPDFTAWSLADLKDELVKAACLLEGTPGAIVRFYSRSPFGLLAKLREYSAAHPDEASYAASLTVELRKVDGELASLMHSHAPSLSTYDFHRRTVYDVSPELDQHGARIRERLQAVCSNPGTAFDTLWRHLDQLGARMVEGENSAATMHRLTKSDLQAILHRAGAMLAPAMDAAELRTSLAGISAIGRSWRRDISGRRVASQVVVNLLNAVDSGHRSILLTGLPGSGKTCAMLALQEALEQRAQADTGIVPLFIQSREFADLETARDREAQGLPEKWVEKVARMADASRVVVVIDSLDVLSIAREHGVLRYFLAQIDLLLQIPNTCVVTACRDFDRHYDRRLAERKWDCELQCSPLGWESECQPLLCELGIEVSSIDVVTQELICNPRELALFVELAQRGGSFNVVNAQALSQRYIDTVVRDDPALGVAAVQSIEAIALDMLQARSLTIPSQRIAASQDMQRRLCSLNILQQTHDGRMAFGHQTLLDVLVISGAIRRGFSLKEFILELPPVPFIRPSIRSFVMHLAMGGRREFRKQVRAVLVSNAAFHIRRLVAEAFAEQAPQDDDWPLIRDLRNQHREMFFVIYGAAKRTEWNPFWMRHLVPLLKETRDAEGLTAHGHRVAQWVDADPCGVLALWCEIMDLDFIDANHFAVRLPLYLMDIDANYLDSATPLLVRMLDRPITKHSFLGKFIARSVSAGAATDEMLWRFVAGAITDDVVLGYGLGDKVRCRAHEFGNSSNVFFQDRMRASTALLDLAVSAIERWSNLRASKKGDWMAGRSGFLGQSSYRNAHSKTGIQHIDGENILLDAMEDAILHHAELDSVWWRDNRDRLCFSSDYVLRYFAVRALAKVTAGHGELTARVLSDKELLESELAYEVGELICATFIYLAPALQDMVMQSILAIHEEWANDEERCSWAYQHRAELILAIPSHLRSPAIQAALNTYQASLGKLERQPQIYQQGGLVSAPFPYDVFVRLTDEGVVRLLKHYRHDHMDGADFLLGGAREVGGLLREVASRCPARFLRLLASRWSDLPSRFRDDILGGVASFLAYRHGNLQANAEWTPLEEPEVQNLASQILDELELHPSQWQHSHAASKALEACAHVVEGTQESGRLVFLAAGFLGLREEASVHGKSVDLITKGINMATGRVAEAVMTLTERCKELSIPFPELLEPVLRRFAGSDNPAIRALILRRLPYLQSREQNLGWEMFEVAMEDSGGLWTIAEPCLYYAYQRHFDIVSTYLARLRREGTGSDLETWGRISALAALTGHIDHSGLLDDLLEQGSTEAWKGCATVWTHPENLRQHRCECIAGLLSGLNAPAPHATVVALQMDHVFRDTATPISIPVELIRCCFSVMAEGDGEKTFYQFHEWLNAMAERDPELTLATTETYLEHVKQAKPDLYDHDNSIGQLMTRLFAEAEEREEADEGAMLLRVVRVQDELLSLGLEGVSNWLEAAERP